MAVEQNDPGQRLLGFTPILDAFPLPSALLDRAGHVQGWNKAAERTFGWSAEEVIGGPPPGIPAEERDAFKEQLRRALGGETVVGLEGHRSTKDGAMLAVRLTAGPLYDERGRIVGAVRTFEDISDRVRAEEALRARERQLQLALQASNMVAWDWDRGSNVVSTTDNLADIYGVTSVEKAEQGFAMVHPGDAERHRATVDAAISSGQSYHSEFRIIRPDSGETVWLEERGMPLLDESGVVQRLSGVVMDITLRKESEEALRGQAALLDLTSDAVLVRDFAGDTVRFWNRAAEEQYGISRDEAIGQVSHTLLQTIHPIPIAEAKEILVRTGRWEGELIHTKRDGTRIIVASRWALQKDGEAPASILETNTDITERKRTEEALLQSEERYRGIVQTANEGVWMVDVEARTMYANDRIASMLGCTAQEMSERTVLDFLFPGDEPLAQERIVRNLNGAADQFDFRFRRRDGSELLVLACTSPVRDSQGNIVGALGMFTDIGERFRAEQERLRLLAAEQQARAVADEARQRLTFLSDASKVLASSLDYETTLSSVARLAVERIADWCAIHLIERSGETRQITVMHPDPARVELARELERRFPYDPEARNGVPQVLRTGEPELLTELTDELLDAAPIDDEVRGILRDLGFRSWIIAPLIARDHILGAITFVAAESGRRYGANDLALAQELAARAGLAVDNARLYSEAQRVAAERSAILAQMADGVAISDVTGRIVFTNDAAERINGTHASGAPIESVITTFHISTVDGEPYPLDDLPLVRALRDRETTADAQWRLRRLDGREIIIQGSAAPLVGENGDLLGAVSTFRDVTAQRTLEQQRDQFLSSAAHDLKTPLTTIRGLAQIMLRRMARGTAAPEQLRDGLGRIEQTTSRMTALINELLDLTRLQMGQSLELNRRETDLVALVSRSIAEHQEVADGQRVTLLTELPDLIGVWDSDRLDRVISNLLSNAIKYSPEGGEITVTVAQKSDGGRPSAIVSVQDEGIGIPAEDLPHIFDRFHRGRNVGDAIGGTGIGLAASKQIVEQHEGTITVQSREGVGSTFTVRLPVPSSAH